MAGCGRSKLLCSVPLARGCRDICLHVTAPATLPVLLCKSEGCLIKGHNQPNSCEPQRGCCLVPSPPLVLLLSLGEEQLPEAL